MDYKKYKSDIVTAEKLDELMKFVIDSGTGTWGSIIAGLKLLVCFAYLYTRNALIDKQLLIDKQNLEVDLDNELDDQNEVNN